MLFHFFVKDEPSLPSIPLTVNTFSNVNSSNNIHASTTSNSSALTPSSNEVNSGTLSVYKYFRIFKRSFIKLNIFYYSSIYNYPGITFWPESGRIPAGKLNFVDSI